VADKRQLRLFVLIDALGWELAEQHDFLGDVLPFRKPLRTVLGFSSGAIPTILTGLLPAKTGHWNLFYYDPEGSPFRWLKPFGFLPDWVLDHRVTRKLLKEAGRHVLGLGPLFECCVSPRLLPWFNWTEKRDIFDRGGISGAASIFDHLTEKQIPYRVYSYHQWTDEEILRQVRRDLESREAEFLFLYLSEMDMFLHHHCQDGNQLEQRLHWYGDGLRELYRLAQSLDPGATFTIFSDHGMTPVRHHYDLVKDVEALGFSMPADYLAVYDSTMARFWFFNGQARHQTVRCLETQPCGRIVPDDELRQLGIMFPDRRYGEVIFLLHPGWLLSRSDFNGRGWMPVGMHGYHPEDPYSDAVFLSNRKPPVEMRTIADVYGCMSEAVAQIEA
jgi:predicted AlkP superfamily pyrophosphatase or phosphodiesterase